MTPLAWFFLGLFVVSNAAVILAAVLIHKAR